MAEQNPFAHLNVQPAAAPQPQGRPMGVVGGPTPSELRAEESLGIQRSGEARQQRGEQRDIEQRTFERGGKLYDQYVGRTAVKMYEAAWPAFTSAISQPDTTQGNRALIYNAIKIFDPEGAVPSGDIEGIESSSPILQRIIRSSGRLLDQGGNLPPEQRKELLDALHQRITTLRGPYNLVRSDFERRSQKIGIDPLDTIGSPIDQADADIYQNWLKGQPPAPAAGGAAQPPAVAPIKAGEAFQTEADLAAQRQLQDAWARGLSVDDMIQFNQQIGRGAFSPEDIQRMRDARAQNKPKAIRFYATPTGQPTAAQGIIGAALETPVGEDVGGYAVGAANALTAGTLDELAPILGLDPARVQAAKDYLRERAPTASLAGEVTGGILGSIPALRGAGAALAGTRLAGAAPLIGEAAYGTAYGAGEAPEDQRALGALIGGGSALLGGALANRFLPGGPGTFTGMAPEVPAAGRFAGAEVSPERIIAAGEQANIPVMTSDIRPPETFVGKIGQQVGEVVPLGTAGMRRGQQQSREQAVETLLADAGITIDRDIAGDLVQNLTEKRGADLRKFTDMKREVIERYAGVGDVTATKSLDAIDSLIAQLEGENLPRQLGGLIQQLQDVKTSLSGPGNLNKIEANRSTLFDLKADPNLASISSKSEKAFKRVYDALNEDMGDFIKANGDMRDFNRWKVANVKLATMAGELRQGGLKRVLDQGEFNPQTVTRMLTSVNPQEARLLFTNLGKEGRANARLLLLQTAAQKAYDANTGIVNPNTFAREVGRLKSNFGQFFGGAEAERVNGLVAVLNATRRAQEAQFAPRTGERLVPFATAGGFGWLGSALGFDPVTGLASSAAFGAAKRFYESAAARDLLLKIGKASGSEKGRLVSDFTQRAAAVAAPVAAERIVGPEAGPPEGAIMVRPQQ